MVNENDFGLQSQGVAQRIANTRIIIHQQNLRFHRCQGKLAIRTVFSPHDDKWRVVECL
jgi:hypothetical protein